MNNKKYMTDERVCSSGHVLDADKELCSRCGGVCVNSPIKEEIVDNAVVNEEKSVDNESEVLENGSTEPVSAPIETSNVETKSSESNGEQE